MMVGSYTNMRTSAALLLAMTTTTTLVQPSGARSSSSSTFIPPSVSTVLPPFSSTVFSSSTFNEECAAEVLACNQEDTCNICSSFNEVNGVEFQECVEDITLDDTDSLAAVCSAYMNAVCCIETISDDNCVSDGNFGDLLLCSLEALGCSFDELTCEANSGAAGLSGGLAAVVGNAFIAALTCALFAHLSSQF